MSDADKELVVTAEVLADAGYQFKPDARYATWAKARLFDGSYELRYEYEDANEEQPIYITSWVEAHRSDTEASVTWHTSQVAMQGTWKVLGVGIEAFDRADLLPWGSAHRTGILRRDGIDVGSYFFFRDGARTHMTVMMGICIGEPEEASGLWKPRLERLSGHSF